MDTLSDERVLEIIAGCEGVTPGPWTAFYKHKYDEYHVGVGSGAMKLALFSDGCPTENPQLDSEHIARLDPQTVSSLATELLALRKRVEELEGALTPTAATKAAYMGEFTIVVERTVNDDMEPDDEVAGAPDPYEHIQVPWTTIKDIMAAIRAFASPTPKEPS